MKHKTGCSCRFCSYSNFSKNKIIETKHKNTEKHIKGAARYFAEYFPSTLK